MNQACKKETLEQVLSCNFVKLLRIPFLQNTSRRLLLVSLCLQNGNLRNKLFMKKYILILFPRVMTSKLLHLLMWLGWRLYPGKGYFEKGWFSIWLFRNCVIKITPWLHFMQFVYCCLFLCCFCLFIFTITLFYSACPRKPRTIERKICLVRSQKPLESSSTRQIMLYKEICINHT